jgi:hypothetical protein
MLRRPGIGSFGGGGGEEDDDAMGPRGGGFWGIVRVTAHYKILVASMMSTGFC